VDDAAGGIAPEQRALRAAQHLDALDVEELQGQATHRRLVDVIHIDGHRVFLCIGEVIQTDAAQEEIDLAGFALRHRVIEVRRHLRDVNGVGKAHVADLLGAEGRDRDTDLLQVLFTALGGYHHLLERGLGHTAGECRQHTKCCSK
jgi:hypothetical protein